jgi:pimeloyl-ACP methyl ester carboxylesterase
MASDHVAIPAGEGPLHLDGTLGRPAGATGLVIFAHGSGSSRLSPRNAAVAQALQRDGLATLLFDLLDAAEARDRGNVFDIPLLGARVAAALRWAGGVPELARLPTGLFGASTGAAAALAAAAERPEAVAAVVSRGGRPDLAGPALPRVAAPTRLIVGGRDIEVLRLNEQARARMRCPGDLKMVEGATHLFEEPGALEEVTRLASAWFRAHLRPAAAGR